MPSVQIRMGTARCEWTECIRALALLLTAAAADEYRQRPGLSIKSASFDACRCNQEIAGRHPSINAGERIGDQAA